MIAWRVLALPRSDLLSKFVPEYLNLQQYITEC